MNGWGYYRHVGPAIEFTSTFNWMRQEGPYGKDTARLDGQVDTVCISARPSNQLYKYMLIFGPSLKQLQVTPARLKHIRPDPPIFSHSGWA